MTLSGAVVFAGGAEVGSGPLVTFAAGPADKLELAGDDGSPDGRIEGTVVLAGAVGRGPEVTGAVSFAALVTFAGGEAGPVAFADVGAAPLSEGPGEAVGAVPLPVEDAGRGPVLGAKVPLPGNGAGTVVLPGAGAVPFVGSGSSKVVEFSDTTILVAVDAVALVGTGEVGMVEFNGREPLVEAGADTDALLDAIPEVGSGELTPVPDGGGAGAVPLSVGKGGDVVGDPGSGGKEVSPDGRGAKTVVELATMIRLVAAADPLMLIVVTPVIAPADEITLIGTEVEDSLPEGSGATTVVKLAGALVSAAVPLVTTVVRLPVITPGGGAVVPEIEGGDALPVGIGATNVVELRGTTTLVAAVVPLTKTVETLPGIPLGLAVLLAKGAEDGIPGALVDNEGGSPMVTVVTDGPGETPGMH